MRVQEHADSTIAWPDTGSSGLRVPYQVFTDAEIYAREQEKIFRGPTWSFLALEAELPNPGDFKTTYVGDTPVIVTRDQQGGINVVANRCAHRGALVCRTARGNADTLMCVYHQWTYDLQGKLTGVPFRRGLKGVGGMPADFDMAHHNLNKLSVTVYAGLVFASFDPEVEPLEVYLDENVLGSIDRIFNRPLKILGDQRQLVQGNWKLYAENTRDPYHASLLHLFHCTFGLYRSTQKGGSVMDRSKRHSLLTARKGTDTAGSEEAYQDTRSYNPDYTLQDPSLLAGRKEFDDDVTLVILAIFPNLIVQQIANTLAVRQIVPHGPDKFELVWTQFGYADDDEEMAKIRLKQGNLIGPAGLISMEDGEAVEIVQDAIIRDQDESSYIAMGGGTADDAHHLVTEGAIIGFWQNYRSLMDL